MTHRSDIAWLDVNMSVDEIRDLVRREPHGRYPVGEGSLDRLVGVVYLKDLFSHIGDPGFSLRQILSPVKLFHEGAEVYMALEQLRTEQLGYGIVCDEFGVTQGIVTLKDIFEALVGELLEDREEPDIVVREDGSVLVDGPPLPDRSSRNPSSPSRIISGRFPPAATGYPPARKGCLSPPSRYSSQTIGGPSPQLRETYGIGWASAGNRGQAANLLPVAVFLARLFPIEE